MINQFIVLALLLLYQHHQEAHHNHNHLHPQDPQETSFDLATATIGDVWNEAVKSISQIFEELDWLDIAIGLVKLVITYNCQTPRPN